MPTDLPPNYVPGAPRAPVAADDAPDSAPDSGSAPPPAPGRQRLLLPLGLFLATLFSVFLMGSIYETPADAPEVVGGWLEQLRLLPSGWPFAVPLMAILVTHELGHYVAARIHRVPASLPYFIPLPKLSPFGTMGAVISMPTRIKSRNALLDIGAAGPLAGLVVAIPVLVIGLLQSEVKPVSSPSLQEGQCLLYMLLKLLVVGPIPEGSDVYLSSTAFAGWAGLLVTSLNLIPIGQLDGGHIGYALFGARHERVGRVLHYSLPLVYLYNLLVYRSFEVGLVWVVWFVLLMLVRRHPPTEPGELSKGRRAVAVLCLVLFVLLFMPTPMRLN
ncbi:MAG: site-2 protease family protein [Polyangiaceae bacterium]|nr:site-2 protease family protein [Polyangiaceae bacterium]